LNILASKKIQMVIQKIKRKKVHILADKGTNFIPNNSGSTTMVNLQTKQSIG